MHTLEQLRSGALAGFQRVGLSASLTEFPTEIFQLAESLEILDLSGNALRTLPDDLPRLHKGAITSDGLPQSELAACLRAGRHRHLIAMRWRVGSHPRGARAWSWTS